MKTQTAERKALIRLFFFCELWFAHQPDHPDDFLADGVRCSEFLDVMVQAEEAIGPEITTLRAYLDQHLLGYQAK